MNAVSLEEKLALAQTLQARAPTRADPLPPPPSVATMRCDVDTSVSVHTSVFASVFTPTFHTYVFTPRRLR